MTVLEAKIVYGHTNTATLVYNVLYTGALLLVSLSFAEFWALTEADQDCGERNAYVLGGEVYYPSAFVSANDSDVMPF